MFWSENCVDWSMKKLFFLAISLVIYTSVFSQMNDSDANWEKYQIRSQEFDSLFTAKYPDFRGGVKYYSKSKVNGKDVSEIWNYRDLGEGSYQLRIDYREGTTAYSEVYEVFKGELLNTRIAEDEYFDGFDKRVSISWSYDCFWLGSTMVSMSSNGHGRTESDEWDAEAEALGWFKKREKELKEMLAEHE